MLVSIMDIPVNVFLLKIHASLWVNFNQKISKWILTRILSSYKLPVNYIIQNSTLTEKFDHAKSSLVSKTLLVVVYYKSAPLSCFSFSNLFSSSSPHKPSKKPANIPVATIKYNAPTTQVQPVGDPNRRSREMTKLGDKAKAYEFLQDDL